jgi:hypothetical protein
MTELHIAPPGHYLLVIQSEDNRPLVMMHGDGRLEFGPTYMPDDAARIFWKAVEDIAQQSIAKGRETP